MKRKTDPQRIDLAAVLPERSALPTSPFRV
jgi:hypothetical protein